MIPDRGVRSSRTSFRTVQAELTRRIAEGEWALGESIPGEEALAAEFGCSRTTVNRAVQAMAQLGLVVRKRRAGTRVALFPVRSAQMRIPLVRREIEEKGLRYDYQLLRKRVGPAPGHALERFDVPPTSELMRLLCLHSGNHRPFQYEDRWINPAAVPGVEDAPFETVSPNEWLVQNAPFSRAEFYYQAEPASATAAKHLGVATGSPVFVAERLTWLGDEPVTFARLVHPPTYRLQVEL